MNRRQTACGSPHDTSDAAPARRRERVAWLDLFRGAAVLVMIETHVVNTFLAAGLRDSGAFALLNYVNGLVAPSFLFIAGFVQGLERRTSPGTPINYSRRASRLLGIAALGYALHFPVVELAQHRWADALRVGTQFDVLQCLAASLGVLIGLTWLTGKLPRRRGEAVWWCAVAVLATVAVVAAPACAAWTGAPLPLRAFVNQTTGSLFPLLPWAGFVFLGALAGAWPERPLHERAAGIIGLAWLASICRGATFAASSPAFFLERAAWVLALAALCEWTARRRLPVWMLFAGRRSLTLYVAHLVLISALVVAGVPLAALALPWSLALLVVVGATSLAAAGVPARLSSFGPLFRPPQSVLGKPHLLPEPP